MQRENNALRQEMAGIEQEIADFTLEYGVEDSDGDIVWFSSPEDIAKPLEQQKEAARKYANSDFWFDLVWRRVGPPHKDY